MSGSPRRKDSRASRDADATATGDSQFRRLLDLLGDLARELAENGADDARVIAVELRSMLLAREFFLRLLQQTLEPPAQPERGERPAAGRVDPARFLRAWGDSVARVVQLLKARRDAAQQAPGATLDRLLDEALAELEALPGLQPCRSEEADHAAQA